MPTLMGPIGVTSRALSCILTLAANLIAPGGLSTLTLSAQGG
jgi:hypothetical protein